MLHCRALSQVPADEHRPTRSDPDLDHAIARGLFVGRRWLQWLIGGRGVELGWRLAVATAVVTVPGIASGQGIERAETIGTERAVPRQETSAPAAEVHCLRELTKEERDQDRASRAVQRKAGNLPVLEPDDDQLPTDVPAVFKPQLVVLTFSVDADGRVSDCNVTKASPLKVFDQASCNLLRSHYRSRPSAQPSGRQTVAVAWSPPAIRPERRACNNNRGTVPVSSSRWITSDVFFGARTQEGAALLALDIGRAGRVERCTVPVSNIDEMLRRNLCDMALKRAVFLPAVDQAGEPVPARSSVVVRFVLP